MLIFNSPKFFTHTNYHSIKNSWTDTMNTWNNNYQTLLLLKIGGRNRTPLPWAIINIRRGLATFAETFRVRKVFQAWWSLLEEINARRLKLRPCSPVRWSLDRLSTTKKVVAAGGVLGEGPVRMLRPLFLHGVEEKWD